MQGSQEFHVENIVKKLINVLFLNTSLSGPQSFIQIGSSKFIYKMQTTSKARAGSKYIYSSYLQDFPGSYKSIKIVTLVHKPFIQQALLFRDRLTTTNLELRPRRTINIIMVEMAHTLKLEQACELFKVIYNQQKTTFI